MRSRQLDLLSAVGLGVVFLVAAPPASLAEEVVPALGLILDQPSSTDPGLPPLVDQRGVYVRLNARWSEVEHDPGSYDWSGLDAAVERLVRSGYRVVLALTGSHPHHVPSGGPPSTLEGKSIQAWLGFVRSAMRSLGDRVEVLEIWSGGDDPSRGAPALFEPAAYAFLLKSSALEARSEASALDTSIRIAQAPVTAGALDWQRRLWNEDSAAYIDILPVAIDPAADDRDLRRQVEALAGESLLHPPAAELWAYHTGTDRTAPWASVEAAVRSLAAGVNVALAVRRGTPEQKTEQAFWLVGADRLFGAGYAPAPPGDCRFISAGGEELPDGRVLGRFFSDADFSTLIVYSLPGATEELPGHRLVVDTAYVRNPRLLDPADGNELRVSSAPVEGGARGRVIRVASDDHPRVLVYEKPAASEGFELPPEEVETTGARELTAEEIVARFQQVQENQDDYLERWMATARIDFHFKFALGGPTIDVAIDSNYFWERGGQVEWEQTGYFIQGNRVTWKNIPQIPFIQPEKVATLPLDLTLDKTYRFRLVGRDRVGERDAYVLAFDPADPVAETSLYRGRVWIDSENFARLKVNLLQTNMEAPVLSNEERDLFRAETGPDGRTYWLLDTIRGQQLWTVAGRNLVVRREVTFLTYQVNPAAAEFERRRAEAYASKNQMLRDTETGFRYLERRKDGSRTVTEKMKTSQLFAAGGAFKDESTDGVVPLAGVNYFDFDMFGKDIQFNGLFGGVLGFVNITKPGLAGTKMDLAGDGTFLAIKTEDKLFSADQELVEERIRRRQQNLWLRLGIPAGQFAKFTLIGNLGWHSYYDDPDALAAQDAIRDSTGGVVDLRYVLPADHTRLTGTFLAEFNRRGYSFSLSASHSQRSEWGEFGLFDDTIQSFRVWDEEVQEYVPGDPEPVYESYEKWGVSAFKEWILPAFQKFKAEINYVDGKDLDRFSRYEFSLFGEDRMEGFSGSGVRFDRGTILRASYAFNLMEAIRFGADLETAWVDREDTTTGIQSHTGLGLSGNVVGPWQTVISLGWGYALDSDIPELKGQQEFFLLILKLF
jgi:hypothetical protein